MEVFLLILLILSLIYYFTPKNKSGNNSGKYNSTYPRTTPDEARREYTDYYREEYRPVFQKREYFFRSIEREFYQTLLKAISDSPYYVFAQVRLADLIKTDPNDPYEREMYIRTLSYQIDYVICEGSLYKIVLAIELDSPHHHTIEQQERDLFKSKVLHDANIPLSRFRVEENFTPVTLRAKLIHYLPSLTSL